MCVVDFGKFASDLSLNPEPTEEKNGLVSSLLKAKQKQINHASGLLLFLRDFNQSPMKGCME